MSYSDYCAYEGIDPNDPESRICYDMHCMLINGLCSSFDEVDYDEFDFDGCEPLIDEDIPF